MTRSRSAAVGASTLIEVWAPHCSACRAIEPGLLAAADSHPSVEVVRIDATAEPARARAYGVRGTPTLIGVVAGDEVFRHVGRLGPAEMDRLFASLSERSTPATPVGERWLWAAAGVILAGAGALLGPSWPLVVLGVAIGMGGVVPLLQRHR